MAQCSTCASACNLDTDGGALASGADLLLVIIVSDVGTVLGLAGSALGEVILIVGGGGSTSGSTSGGTSGSVGTSSRSSSTFDVLVF